MDDNGAGTKKDGETHWTWFLFSVEGRISRKPYWIFLLFVSLGAFILSFFTGATINLREVNNSQILYLILMFGPSMAVLAKRWHDLNKSALWALIIFVPIVGPIWTLVETGFKPGTNGPNEFGPDPLDHSVSGDQPSIP